MWARSRASKTGSAGDGLGERARTEQDLRHDVAGHRVDGRRRPAGPGGRVRRAWSKETQTGLKKSAMARPAMTTAVETATAIPGESAPDRRADRRPRRSLVLRASGPAPTTSRSSRSLGGLDLEAGRPPARWRARNVRRSTARTARRPSKPAKRKRSCSAEAEPGQVQQQRLVAPAQDVVRGGVHLVGQRLAARRRLGDLQQEARS